MRGQLNVKVKLNLCLLFTLATCISAAFVWLLFVPTLPRQSRH